MPQYYYAVAGMLVLVVMLLIMRAQKAKAAKVDETADIHEGWLPTSVATATPDTWAGPVDESKRQARARVRAEAKAAAKNAADAKAQAKAAAKADAKAAKSGVRAPVDAIGDEPPARAKRHRRSKHSAVDVAKAAEVVQEAAPALINQDGWLTTVEDLPAEPMQAQPVQAVHDGFQPPTPAYAVPQQQAPDNQVPDNQARGNQAPEQDAPVYAMAGAPAQHAEAAVAAPQAAVAPTSFNELMTAPPASAVPEPVVPELPLGPYTYGARTILPGK